MRRFMVGLVLGIASGAIAWYSTYSVAATAFVGAMVALTVWFTKASDWVVEAIETGVEWVLKLVLRALD